MTAPKKPLLLLRVSATFQLTPHMIRVTLQGEGIKSIRPGCEGSNCKLFLPQATQSLDDFANQLVEGPRPVVRTYTVRYIRPLILLITATLAQPLLGQGLQKWVHFVGLLAQVQSRSRPSMQTTI